MSRSLSQPDDRAQALKAIYDGLRMALDGAYQYQLASLALEQDQAVPPIEKTTRATGPIPIDRRELTVKDLAGLWQVSTRSIYQWKDTQGLPYKKRGRLLRFDWIEASRWRQE